MIAGLPLLVGGLIEVYEAAVFGLLEEDLTDAIFSGQNETWLMFAIATIAMPPGVCLFAYLGSLYGEKRLTLIAIFGITTGECAAAWPPRGPFGWLRSAVDAQREASAPAVWRRRRCRGVPLRQSRSRGAVGRAESDDESAR